MDESPAVTGATKRQLYCAVITATNVGSLLQQERRTHTTINQSVFFYLQYMFFLFFLRGGIIRSQCMYSSSALLRWLRFLGLADPGILKTTCMAGSSQR